MDSAKITPKTYVYRMKFAYDLDTGVKGITDQEEALKDPYTAYDFAIKVPGADIEKCQEAACKDPRWAYKFAIDVPGANIGKSIEACKGTDYETVLNEHLMEIALG